MISSYGHKVIPKSMWPPVEEARTKKRVQQTVFMATSETDFEIGQYKEVPYRYV